MTFEPRADSNTISAGSTLYWRGSFRLKKRLSLSPHESKTLVATAGYMICFSAGWWKRKSLYDYSHWPVAPDHFADMYTKWDDPAWKPKPGQKHLMSLGCRPYTSVVGVWAKRMDQPQMIQGVEHTQPVEAPAGAWLLLGAKGSALGAPYWVADKTFRARYMID
ncbi:MAG: hypothetical protein IH589_04975 [Anaerolineales bacterium]|nr:hypothetical protein [Anaerolineales bacterium]